MSTRAHIQSLSSIGPILVKIFEVVERWVPVEVVHDSMPGSLLHCALKSGYVDHFLF
jgi:hypothetical protein